jgi:hypothetical protein
MTRGQDEKPDAEVEWLRTEHPSWAIVRLDTAAIRAMRDHTGNQQITSSYDADELHDRLKQIGPIS